MSPTGKERRRENRYSKHLSVQLYDEKREAIPGQPLMVDLSVTGMCFEIAVPPAVGATFTFRIHLPKEGMVAGNGIVRWVTPSKDAGKHLAGLSFERLGWTYQQALRAYLTPHVTKRRPLEEKEY